MRKGTLITLGVIIVVVIAIYALLAGNYNKMVSAEEGVKSQWSQVENQYQRRADLIPNLVSTVKGYASHEQETLNGVVEARAKATQTTISVNDLSAANIQKFEKAQSALSSALSRLLVSVERYPDLKANQNFMALQAQLEGTENRISTERMRFNESAKKFNTMIRTFPSNIIAGMMGFSKMDYFASKEGADVPVEVKF